MIELNLLPEERRPVERTPLPRFLTILGGVAGFCIEVVLLIFIQEDYQKKDIEREDLIVRIGRAKDRIIEVDKLQKEVKGFKDRRADIERLYKSRRVWGPILYRLSDRKILPANVWYTEIELKEGRGAARSKTASAELYISGYARGAGVDPMFQAIKLFESNLMADHVGFSEQFEGRVKYVKALALKSLAPDKESPNNAPTQALGFSFKRSLNPKRAAPPGGRR